MDHKSKRFRCDFKVYLAADNNNLNMKCNNISNVQSHNFTNNCEEREKEI